MWGNFAKKERGLDSYLPYIGFVDKGILKLKNGGFLVSYRIRGQDLASSTTSELGQVSRIVNSALMKLGDGWMAHVDTVRMSSSYYPNENECFFPDFATKSIDDYRRKIFESNDTCYENNYYLTLTYTASVISDKNMFFFLNDTDDKTPNLEKVLKKFEESLVSFFNIFSTYIHVERLDDEELLTYLHFCITGKKHKVSVPVIPMYIDTILASVDVIDGEKTMIGNKHFRAISLKSFPSYLSIGLLEMLNSLMCEFRFSSRFIFLDQSTSRKKVEKIRKDWDQSKVGIKAMLNDKIGGNHSTTFLSGDSVNMTHDADAAVQELSANALGYGFYTQTIILFDEDEERIDDNARKLIQKLEIEGFTCFIEKFGAMESWLGSMPGNATANVRRPLISTRNFSHIIPLTAAWSGDPHHPHFKNRYTYKPAPPLFSATCDGNTPFRVSLYVKDVGHTLVIGSTGGGKTTLLAFIIAQFFRYYNAQVFAFDKEYCLWTLCQASGGAHFELSAGKAKSDDDLNDKPSISFCPLAKIDSPDEKMWVLDWLCLLFELQHNRPITVNEQEAIVDALSILSKETTSPSERKLSKFASQVQNFEVRQAIEPYIKKDMYGSIFDGDYDFISSSHMNVFEMNELMNSGEKILIPSIMYMFKSIKNSLDGRPTMIVLDEAWTFFKHELFSKKIEEWLREMRRYNCYRNH